MVDPVGTTKYTYYAGSLLNAEDGAWANDTVTNIYNNARMRSGLVLQQPTNTWTNDFTWDAAHRLSTVSSSAGTFTNNYVGAGRLILKLALPNTSYITNVYDNVARLTGTYLNSSSNTILDKAEYLYNAGNQRIRLTRTDSSYYTNNYDNIGQLKWADSTVAAEDRGYLYDAAWNLSKRTNNASTDTFAVDSKNQYTSGPGGSFSYDDNGNLTYYGQALSWERYFTYDAENQLVTVEVPGYFKSTFTYDGRGRRRQRTEYTWNGSNWVFSQTINYIYDGMRVIQERDNSGNTPLVSYTRGSDLSGSFEGAGGIGGLLARSHAYQSGSGGFTNHNFYHADGNGNITYMVSSSQSMAASYRYDPFGRTISSSGTLASANLYRFSSKEVDPNYTDSGLYYYGYRYYDPNLQRWLNRDPLGDISFRRIIGAPVSRKRIDRNLYLFVQNGPIASIDAFGLDKTPWPFNGSVCNCKDNKKPVFVLIDSEYYKLGPGRCTGDNPASWDDVDGFWVGGEFYAIRDAHANACDPPENTRCQHWNGESDNPNSPHNRGAPNDTPPTKAPPYKQPPYVPGPGM